MSYICLTSLGVMLAFGFFVGALGPWLLGWIKATRGLEFGLTSLSVVYFAAGVCMLVGRFFFLPRDYVQETPGEGA